MSLHVTVSHYAMGDGACATRLELELPLLLLELLSAAAGVAARLVGPGLVKVARWLGLVMPPLGPWPPSAAAEAGGAAVAAAAARRLAWLRYQTATPTPITARAATVPPTAAPTALESPEESGAGAAPGLPVAAAPRAAL